MTRLVPLGHKPSQACWHTQRIKHSAIMRTRTVHKFVSASKELADKCTKAAAFISRSPLNCDEAWTYDFAIFLPSVGYPLPLCHFSKSALDKIQWTVMSSLIAKCGYNRKTKRERDHTRASTTWRSKLPLPLFSTRRWADHIISKILEKPVPSRKITTDCSCMDPTVAWNVNLIFERHKNTTTTYGIKRVSLTAGIHGVCKRVD